MVVVIKIQGQVQQSTESLWSRCKRTLMIHLTTRRMTNTRNHGEKRPTVTLLNECKSPPEKIFTTMCILHLWQSTILQSLELFILQILELLACLRIYPLFQISFLLIFLYSYHCIFFHKQRGYLEWLYIDDDSNPTGCGIIFFDSAGIWTIFPFSIIGIHIIPCIKHSPCQMNWHRWLDWWEKSLLSSRKSPRCCCLHQISWLAPRKG